MCPSRSPFCDCFKPKCPPTRPAFTDIDPALDVVLQIPGPVAVWKPIVAS